MTDLKRMEARAIAAETALLQLREEWHDDDTPWAKTLGRANELLKNLDLTAARELIEKAAKAEQIAGLQQQLAAAKRDGELLDYLNEQVVDTIYLDDGTLIDVQGEDVRRKIDAARQKEGK
jgi:hypothetical protein